MGSQSNTEKLKKEKNFNLYDGTETFYIETGRGDKKTTYWYGKEKDGGTRITEEFYNDLKNYNDYRNIANQGMAPGITNNPLKKKRKSIFNQDRETIFGN